MAAATGNTTNCHVELDFAGRWRHRYSLPPSTTVAQLKQNILHDFGISPERITLRLQLLPYPTTTMEHQTLAAYGVTAGQTTWPIAVEVAKVNVMVNFLNLDNMWYFVVACYEFDSVAEFRRLVVDNLRSTGVDEIGPEDMELYCGGVRCGDGGARLSQYGVRDKVWVDVKTTKEVRELRRRFTSAL